MKVLNVENGEKMLGAKEVYHQQLIEFEGSFNKYISDFHTAWLQNDANRLKKSLTTYHAASKYTHYH
jgi:CRISPR/Cas system type I-B associated protein Csh2 (Cas7 group RAMP superfamily)